MTKYELAMLVIALLSLIVNALPPYAWLRARLAKIAYAIFPTFGGSLPIS